MDSTAIIFSTAVLSAAYAVQSHITPYIVRISREASVKELKLRLSPRLIATGILIIASPLLFRGILGLQRLRFVGIEEWIRFRSSRSGPIIIEEVVLDDVE